MIFCVFYWIIGHDGGGGGDGGGGDGGRISDRVQAPIPSHPGIKYPVRDPPLTPIFAGPPAQGVLNPELSAFVRFRRLGGLWGRLGGSLVRFKTMLKSLKNNWFLLYFQQLAALEATLVLTKSPCRLPGGRWKQLGRFLGVPGRSPGGPGRSLGEP